MADEPPTDSGSTVDPADSEAVRDHLERFAGAATVTEADNGTLTAEFSVSTFVSVTPEGHVTTGMPLHGFEGHAESLRFDHDAGELHVTAGGAISYTFRRPSR